MEFSSRVVLNSDMRRYELLILNSASLEQYEDILSLIVSRLETKIIEAVNDFDNYYHSFFCLNEKVVLNFSNDFGVKAILFGNGVDLTTQYDVLSYLDRILRKN
jgi:hypothetical protein